jgi:hypothetical protein
VDSVVPGRPSLHGPLNDIDTGFSVTWNLPGPVFAALYFAE